MKKLLLLTVFLFGCVYYSTAQEDLSEEQYLFDEIEAYIYSPNQERKKSKEYFSKIKELGELGNSEALYYLGLLQKEGIGTKQSFKKSRKSFKRAYELGNSRAAYCVGYYFLKGFGDIQQDYTKAYMWFKKSDDPMAKHWMAKMQFLGLGRESNKNKALSLLNSNDLYNSQVLYDQYLASEPPSKNSSILFKELIDEYSIKNLHDLNNLNKVPNFNVLQGDWEGEFVELDWAKNKIFRTLPLELCLIEEQGINEQFKAELKIVDSLVVNIGSYSSGALRFGSLQIPIKKQYTDYPNFTHLITDIKDFELREIQFKGETLIIGRVSSSFPVWQERANPALIILKKKSNISEEALTAFEQQADDFLRLYPNPFTEYFLINFDLQNETNVKVEISNYYNTSPYNQTVFIGNKGEGNNTIEVNNPPTKSGYYVVSIEYNGNVENKIIIKN